MRLRLFLLVLLVSTLGFSQADEKPFTQWGAEVEIGGHSLVAANFSGDDFVHIGVLGRYNFNRTFGLGLRLGLDMFEIIDDTGQAYDRDYVSLNLEAIADLLDIVDLNNEKFTILAHGGPGVAFTQKSTFFNLSGGFTGLFKVGDHSALKLDYTMHGNYNQAVQGSTGEVEHLNGLSSIVNTFSVGLAVYFGDKTPVDFMSDECCGGDVIIHQGDTTIVNNNQTLVTKIIREEYTPVIQEFVFFKHDKDKIRKSELNAVYQIYNALQDIQDSKVRIIGYASATASSDQYNLELAERRCLSLATKLALMGIDDSRIIIDPEGKDFHLDNIDVHDLARRVELRLE